MLVALLALIFVANGLVYQPRSGLTLFQQFHEYTTFWNKTHDSHAEKVRRFENFQMNAQKIAELNAQTVATGRGATFGFTKFSDWSLEEFKAINGFVPRQPLVLNPVPAATPEPTGAIDWVAKGMTTPVKDQGQCGSCWAFSTTETIESANLLAGNAMTIGSPQEIVDCDSNDAGCNGGDPQEALNWVVQQGGLEADSCYPYTAEDGTCNEANCQPVMKISTVTPVAGDEGSIYTALQGMPLSICCDAEPWQNYQGGIMTADQCGTSIDHAIQLTGYSPSQGGLDTDSCYPYTAEDGTCNAANCQASPNLNIKTVTSVGQDESLIYNALQSAPLSICCDAEPWQNYQGGIMTADQCGLSIDHAIQLTGYSPNQGGYWIVRNSWGADWGENGFIYLQYGQNTCGITSEVTGASVN
jgi:C1A family cysteine protease